MAEFRERVQQVTNQVTNSVEKAIAEQASRFEAAVGEVSKLQAESLAQAGQIMESMVRLANDQIAFAEQLTGEWRKLVLAATRNAADVFAARKAQ